MHNLLGEPSTGAGCFPTICWFWTYFTKSIQVIWSNWFIQSTFNKFELLSYFDASRLITQLPFALLLGPTSWTNAIFKFFRVGFPTPGPFITLRGYVCMMLQESTTNRDHDCDNVNVAPNMRKCLGTVNELNAELTIMLCPACFSRTTNCSPLFCTLICSRVLQWECVSPMGSSGPFGPPMHVPPRSEATKWRTGNDDNDGGIDLASCRVWWRATNGPSSRHNMFQVSSAFAKTINKKQSFAKKNKHTKNIETQNLTTIDEWPPLALACRLRGFWRILHSRTGTEGGKYSGE